MTLIASIDPSLRRIYLHFDTVGATVHPVDIYKEMRTLRLNDETLRPFDIFMKAYGNISKGGGKFTERYVQLINGTRIVPFDTDGEITINGTIITDDGQEGIACFDRTSLSAATQVDINYTPPQVEVIEVATGGSTGITAQEVWEYGTRDLTVASGISQLDIDAITAQVWTEATRELTSSGAMSAEQATQLKELWQIEGLDPNNPMTATKTTRAVAAILQIFTGDRKSTTTATRQ